MSFIPKITDQDKALLDMLGLTGQARAEAESKILAKKTANVERAEKNRREVRVARGESGKLSLYGLGQRFPVTLADDQWRIVFDNMELVKAAFNK